MFVLVQLDSFIQLVYPPTPETWVEWFCPFGKAQEWVEGNNLPGRAPWMTAEVRFHLPITPALATMA